MADSSGFVRRGVMTVVALGVALTLAALPLAAPGAEARDDTGPAHVIVGSSNAPIVINGRVVAESTTVTTVGGMHLVTEIEVTARVRGQAGEQILIETPGGVNALGMRQVVSHQPAFAVGDLVQLGLLEAPRAEGGVIGAVYSDESLPVYSIVGGSQGAAWVQGETMSQTDKYIVGRADAAGDYALHGASWSAFPVSFRINPSGAPSGAIAAVGQAIETWEAVPGVDIAINYDGTTTSTAPVGDYDNVVAWVAPSNPADTYLAQSTWWMATSNRIVAFDMVFNPIYTMVDGAAQGAFDLESIAVHEFGHVLGLGHVSAQEEVMYPTIPSNYVARVLGAGDRSGVLAMYESATPPTPTPTQMPTATPTAAPTATPMPTATPEPSPTATPDSTPSPHPTQEPEIGAVKGRITVMDDGTPIFGARVCIERLLPATQECAYTDMHGDYAVSDLASGMYSVYVTDLSSRFLDNCAGTSPCDRAEAFGVSATQGGVLADVGLDPTYNAGNPPPTSDPFVGDASISGSVTRAGEPAPDVQICAIALFLEVTKCTTSDAGGSYSIGGLATDNYRVEFGDGEGCYATGQGCVDYVPVGAVSPLARTGIDGAL